MKNKKQLPGEKFIEQSGKNPALNLPLKIRLKSQFIRLVEGYFYRPNALATICAVALLPFSVLYGALAFCASALRPRYEPAILCISVGNLVLGGSNKSPFVRALAQWMASAEFAERIGLCAPLAGGQIAVILRGYGRKSRGLLEVNLPQQNPQQNAPAAQQNPPQNTPAAQQNPPAYELYGDEAIEHKNLLGAVRVIVCEDRREAINYAANSGCKIAVLDDAFNKFFIQKFDFLLEHAQPEYLPFCLPSGPLRHFSWLKKRANFIARPNEAYSLQTKAPARLSECFFLTAIARANRLDAIRARCAASLVLPDHSRFCEEAIAAAMKAHGLRRLVCTKKDLTKLSKLAAIAEPIELCLQLNEAPKDALINYIKEKNVLFE